LKAQLIGKLQQLSKQLIKLLIHILRATRKTEQKLCHGSKNLHKFLLKTNELSKIRPETSTKASYITLCMQIIGETFRIGKLSALENANFGERKTRQENCFDEFPPHSTLGDCFGCVSCEGGMNLELSSTCQRTPTTPRAAPNPPQILPEEIKQISDENSSKRLPSVIKASPRRAQKHKTQKALLEVWGETIRQNFLPRDSKLQ
jgi:hypothetical protein